VGKGQRTLFPTASALPKIRQELAEILKLLARAEDAI
jgi:hypothetical protein